MTLLWEGSVQAVLDELSKERLAVAGEYCFATCGVILTPFCNPNDVQGALSSDQAFLALTAACKQLLLQDAALRACCREPQNGLHIACGMWFCLISLLLGSLLLYFPNHEIAVLCHSEQC